MRAITVQGELYLSGPDSAARIGVSIRQWEGLVRRGVIRGVCPPGCRPRYRVADLDRLAERMRQPAAAGA